MQDFSMKQTQKSSQLQVQKMSRKQILAVKLIAMNNMELRDEIYKFADENPAFEITDDSFSDGIENFPANKKNERISQVRTGTASDSGNALSDKFQKMLENSPDFRESLQEHLLSQIKMSRLNPEEEKLCEKLIRNLDKNGWHFLAPASLLDKNDKNHDEAFLAHCISIVQHLDPVGVCCKNAMESLEVQALQKNADPLSLFIVHGHLDLLSPPDTEKIIRKMNALIKEQEKMAFLKPEETLDKNFVTEKNIEKSVHFIKSLNPYPAQNFTAEEQTQFIEADAEIIKEEGILEKENFEEGLVNASTAQKDLKNSAFHFRIKLKTENIPSYRISPLFHKDFDGLKGSAQSFIDSLEFRNRSILRTFSLLVSLQKDFFSFGPEKLFPLTQKRLSELAGVHESTISRFASSKYLRCEWGIFPVKYFFSSELKKEAEIQGEQKIPLSSVSSASVKVAIKKILEEHTEKKLSDQAVTLILQKEGIKIARRTVSKYRSQLNIESSYRR